MKKISVSVFALVVSALVIDSANAYLTSKSYVDARDVATLNAAQAIVDGLSGTATLKGDINQIKITQTNGKLDTTNYTVTVAQNAITTGKIASSDKADAVANELPIADGNGAVTWTDCGENEALVRSATGWICVGIAV